MPVYEKGKLYTLSLIDLKQDPDQPRKYMDSQALEELTASVMKHGILQPILFREGDDGSVTIVAGERRFEAAKKANLPSIPGIFVEGDPSEIAIVENLQRQDLTAIEESEALDRIMKEHTYKLEDIGAIIGKSVSTVSEILSLNRLPEEIRDECRSDPAIPRRILVEIAKSKQQRGMISLYNKYKEKQLSREGIREARGGQKSKLDSAMTWIAKTIERIDAFNMADWNDGEREHLIGAMTKLKDVIDEKLTTEPTQKFF